MARFHAALVGIRTPIWIEFPIGFPPRVNKRDLCDFFSLAKIDENRPVNTPISAPTEFSGIYAKRNFRPFTRWLVNNSDFKMLVSWENTQYSGYPAGTEAPLSPYSLLIDLHLNSILLLPSGEGPDQR